MIDIKDIEDKINLDVIAYEYAEQECDELIKINYDFISSGNLIDDKLIVWFVDEHKELQFAIKINGKLIICGSPLYALCHLIDDNKNSVDELIKEINEKLSLTMHLVGDTINRLTSLNTDKRQILLIDYSLIYRTIAKIKFKN